MYVYMNCGEDVLNERFYILENYLIFGVSYFFYDCVTMYMVYRYINLYSSNQKQWKDCHLHSFNKESL